MLSLKQAMGRPGVYRSSAIPNPDFRLIITGNNRYTAIGYHDVLPQYDPLNEIINTLGGYGNTWSYTSESIQDYFKEQDGVSDIIIKSFANFPNPFKES